MSDATAWNRIKLKWFGAFERMSLKGLFQTIGSILLILAMIGAGRYVVPKDACPADKVLYWAFAVFVVGISGLFAVFVLLTIWGKVDLAQAFVDKSDGEESVAGEGEAGTAGQQDSAGAPDALKPAKSTTAGQTRKAAVAGSATVSLSRLQVFLWTLIVLIVYFHRVVTNKSGELPTIPAELLMVMGISSAVYLTSKGLDKAKPAQGDTKGKVG